MKKGKIYNSVNLLINKHRTVIGVYVLEENAKQENKNLLGDTGTIETYIVKDIE